MPTLSKISVTWDDEDRPLIEVTYDHGQRDSSADADVDEWLEALVARLTDESAEKLDALIEANEAVGAISLQDLADWMGADKKKIDGWSRNFGRSVKAVVRDYGFLRKDQEDGTAQLFDYEWDQSNNRWKYIVPERYRGAIRTYLDGR
jgi:hypothetical protein